MQTASSAITGFTAPAAGGKPPSKPEEQRGDSAGFAITLRSAMPPDNTPNASAQAPAEQEKWAASDNNDTTTPREVGPIQPKDIPRGEQILPGDLIASTKTDSGEPVTALRRSLTIDTKDPGSRKKAIIRQSDIAPKQTEEPTKDSFTTEKPAVIRENPVIEADRKETELEIKSNIEMGDTQERSSRMTEAEPADTQERNRQKITRADADVRVDTSTEAPVDADDSPLLPKSVAQSLSDKDGVALNTSALSIGESTPTSVQESKTDLANQKPSAVPAQAPTSAAAVPAKGTDISKAGISTGSASNAVGQTADSSVAPNSSAPTKSARAEPQALTPPQGGRTSNKTEATGAGTSTQHKTLETLSTSVSTRRSVDSHGNVATKTHSASHHKSKSGSKTGNRAEELPAVNGKFSSAKAAKGEALPLKQATTANPGTPEAAVDRVALTAANPASRSLNASTDLAAPTAQLPDIDAPFDPADVSEAFQGQLGERLVMAVRNDMSRAEIRINPNELGPITIELNVDGNTAAISFAAENNSTRNALQDSLPSLRDQLAREGLTLGEASVGEHPNRSSDQKEREQQSEQWTERRSSSHELDEDQALVDGYRPPPPAQGLVDLFA